MPNSKIRSEDENQEIKEKMFTQTEISEKSSNLDRENQLKKPSQENEKITIENQTSENQTTISREKESEVKKKVPSPNSNQFLVKREDFFVYDKNLAKNKKKNENNQLNFFKNYFQRSTVELEKKNQIKKELKEKEMQVKLKTKIEEEDKKEKKGGTLRKESNLANIKENVLSPKTGNGSSDSEEIILKKRKTNNILQLKNKTIALKKKPNKFSSKKKIDESDSDTDEEENHKISQGHPSNFDKILLMKLDKDYKNLRQMKSSIDEKIEDYKLQFFYEQMVELKRIKSDVPENGVPICADVTSYNFEKLISVQRETTRRLFDVIMMDPPWQLSTSQPSRGVAIAYSSLPDDSISRLPIGDLQESGFLLIWVINAKYSVACNYFKKWGYQFVDEIVWIKRTVTGKIAKGHGFYLQHAKETCLVGFKGDVFDFKARKYCALNGLDVNEIDAIKVQKRDEIMQIKLVTGNDIIFSERRGQSQKPNEIYDIVEGLVPNGHYLEIFGRRNNIHNRWVTLGNEL